MHSMKSACTSSKQSKMNRMNVKAKASPFVGGSTNPAKPAMKAAKVMSNPMQASGAKGNVRLDKRARGGRVGKHGKTQVNVIVAPQGGAPGAGAAMGAPMPSPAMMPPVMPHPAMAPPPMAAGPGGPPMMPPGAGAPPMMMPRKRGGRVMTAGAGSGEGRLEKVDMKKKSA